MQFTSVLWCIKGTDTRANHSHLRGRKSLPRQEHYQEEDTVVIKSSAAALSDILPTNRVVSDSTTINQTNDATENKISNFEVQV